MNGQILDNESLLIRLNLANIGREIRKLFLILNTICIQVNMGNVQGTFFVIFTITDDNNYKITKLTAFVRSGDESEW